MREDRRQLLARIAYQYYVEGKTQNEIAKEQNLYRTTVSRMLTKAKEAEIIHFVIHDVDESALRLERAFQDRFSLRYIEIVSNTEGESEEAIHRAVGVMASGLIRRLADDNQVIGLSWGTTMSEVINQIEQKKLHGSIVLPLVGGPSHLNTKYHVNTIVYELSKRFLCASRYVNAVAVQETARVAKGILASEYFSELRQYWDRIDFAIIGIGGRLTDQGSRWRDLLSPDDLASLEASHAVGDALCRFFDAEGHIIENEISQRTIAISFEQFQKAKIRLGVAIGKSKVEAILAMLKNRGINALVTDYDTAQAVYALSMSDSADEGK